jgi:hypothetical protein
MEEQAQSNASEIRTLAEIDFPSGDGPVAHAARFLDPRVVEAHFAELPVHRPDPEQRWAKKCNTTPFPGL